MRPRIGITGPDRGGYAAWFFTAWAVRLAGGRPVRITPRRGPPKRRLDGLIVGGGADVEPSRYASPEEAPPVREELAQRSSTHWLQVLVGYAVAPLIYVMRRLFSVKREHPVDEGRDVLETELLHTAFEEGLPVMGICRGAQLLNVTLGGSLHRSTDSFYTESPRPWTVFPAKDVEVNEDTCLASVMQTTRARVNSLHRQAVDRLGHGVRISAREANGIVQGIELDDRPFAVGVQWHPEYLPQRPEQRRLFRRIVHMARQRPEARPHPGSLHSAQQPRRQAPVAHEERKRVHESQRG
jgi:putative glutamine amidotransferase